MSGNEKCNDQNDCQGVQSKEELSASNHKLTPGQQSLKRLKEMPYSKPHGKAFLMGWRKANSSTLKTSNMKNTFLAAIMVAFSFIATAQETYKNHSSAPDFEWYYVKGDTNLLSFKGSSFDMNGIVYNWLDAYGMDPAKPDEKFIDKKSGAEVSIWLYKNNQDQDVRMMYYKNTQKCMVMCRVIN
jgi:hypothetical protein